MGILGIYDIFRGVCVVLFGWVLAITKTVLKFKYQLALRIQVVCAKKGIISTILWPGDGIETINPTL